MLVRDRLGAGARIAARTHLRLRGTRMTAVYTWDVFCTLDGYGSFTEDGDWGGDWSKQGPELLEHRAALFGTEQRMVYGATMFREVAQIIVSGADPNSLDEWNVR